MKRISNLFLTAALLASPSLAAEIHEHEGLIQGELLAQNASDFGGIENVSDFKLVQGDLSSFTDDILISFTQSYYSSLLNGSDSLEGYANQIKHVEVELEHRGVNLIHYFDEMGAKNIRDILASQRLGVEYSGYDMQSGMVDYVTGKPVSIGTMLFNGCVCNNPEEPEEVTVVVSELAPRDIRMYELEGIVSKLEHAQFNSYDVNKYLKEARLDGSSFSIPVGSARDNEFIFINDDSLMSRIEFAREKLDLPDALFDKVSSAYVNEVVHHEVQHGKLVQENFREQESARLKELRNDYEVGDIETGYGQDMLIKGGLMETELFLEVNANTYASAITMHQWLNKGGLSEEEKSTFSDAMLNLSKRSNEIRTMNTDNAMHDVEILKEHLFTSEREIEGLGLSDIQKGKLNELNKELEGLSQRKIDRAFDLMFAEQKSPYQSYHGVKSIHELVNKDIANFQSLTVSDLQSMSASVTQELISSPEFQDFMFNPYSSGVDVNLQGMTVSLDNLTGNGTAIPAYDGVSMQDGQLTEKRDINHDLDSKGLEL